MEDFEYWPEHLHGMSLCSMCDNVNFGLAFYLIGAKEEERNELLDVGLELYELIQTGSKVEYINEENELAYESYRMVESFYSAPKELEEIMQEFTLIKGAIERMKNSQRKRSKNIKDFS